MRWVFIIGICWISSGLRAEAPQAGGNNGNAKLNPNTLNVFDNDFFDSKKDSGPKNVTAGGRPMADEPDYNTQTRSQAMDKCAPLKDKDFAKYQQCYQSDMKKSKSAVQENYDEIEKKQAIPLKNAVNPLIEEQERKGSSFEEND